MASALTRLLLLTTVAAALVGLTALAARSPCLAPAAAGLGVAGYWSRRRGRPSADPYGMARWCSEDDARRAGLL